MNKRRDYARHLMRTAEWQMPARPGLRKGDWHNDADGTWWRVKSINRKLATMHRPPLTERWWFQFRLWWMKKFLRE